jgi:hypothetical protein
VLAKLQEAADDVGAVATLSTNECRVILCELWTWRSTAAITTTPEFHDKVERYRKTGRV